MRLFRKFRPATVDKIAEQADSVYGKIWQIIRMLLLDRALYWGLALAYAVPLVVKLLGGGYTFSGNILHALGAGLAFTAISLATAVVLALGMNVFGVKCAARPKFRWLQKAVFAASAVGFFAGATYLVPSILAVTSIAGYATGTAALYLVAEWALGHRCSGKGCDLKNKDA